MCCLVWQGAQGMLERGYVSSQGTLTREYVRTQGMMAREASEHSRHDEAHEARKHTRHVGMKALRAR